MRIQATDNQAIDEDEVAACLAAISAYIDVEKPQALRAAVKENSWQLASRLEATQRSAKLVSPLPSGSNSTNLWKTIGNKLLVPFLLLAMTVCTNPGQADPQYGFPPNGTIGLYEPAVPLQNVLRQPTPTLIRIGLVLAANSVTIDIPDGAQVCDAYTNEPIEDLPVTGSFRLSLTKNGLTIKGTPSTNDDPHEHILPECLIVPAITDGVIGVNGKFYRGSIIIKLGKIGLHAINIVDLEDYLLSVVPSEMPSNWPAEALKAQAIAARSYALANLGKHESDGYDLKANTEDQVYSGVTAETQSVNEAVAQTAGIVAKHSGKVITAYFHSGSGGSTEASEHVWQKELPYLKAVYDYDDASPQFAWSKDFSPADLESILRRSNNDVGQVLNFLVVSRAPSNRVKQALIVGSKHCLVLSGENSRALFKLPSSNFQVAANGPSYHITGRGWGHGLGLSQWGARELAQQGYNAAQILTYYYKDVTLDYF